MNRVTHADEIRVINQSISVPFSYPVYFTRGVFSPENTIIRDLIRVTGEETGRILVFADSGVLDAHSGLEKKITDYLNSLESTALLCGDVVPIPGGEQAKNGWGQVHAVLEKLQSARLCRHSYVLAAGGGSFLDAVGFASGIFHRGIRLIRIPTTTLSQDDSGVGVKNGINLGNVKNMVGSFNPPFAVINDSEFLWTLPRELMLDGIAEAFKVAIIKDSDFFSFLSEHAEDIESGEKSVIEETVRISAVIHLKHISTSDDPFEFGISRPLDFGHWSAHMLEGMSGYTVRHGQAVAVGICLDSIYAWKKGMISEETMDLIISSILTTGLPGFHPLLFSKKENGEFSIIEGLELFREHLGGTLSITLPTGIGTSVEVHEIDTSLVRESIGLLEEKVNRS